MSEDRDRLLDEAVLRRALRLEFDERPPRFDAAAIAAAAAARQSSARLLAIAFGAAGGLALAVSLGAVVVRLAASLAGPALEGVLTLAAGVAVAATTVLAVAQEPVVPLSLVAALALATLHELRVRKELAHASAP